MLYYNREEGYVFCIGAERCLFLCPEKTVDEREYEAYLRQVFDLDDIGEEYRLHEQLWNEETFEKVPGCYRVAPAKVD